MSECERCGNRNPESFGIRKNGEPYCRLCLSFNGEKAPKNPNLKRRKTEVTLSYSLSEEQKAVSDRLTEAYRAHRDSLVHAVCGAGKTELVYATMGYALSEGHQVGFAIPRKDVVIELTARIKEAFPSRKVIAVYQDHTDDLVGDIVVLTTHQLYRYEAYFDLLIIDEADAFPFKDQPVLHSFFHRSVRGNFIVMSATLSEDMKEEIRKRGGICLSLMTRYHGHPLIVPKPIVWPFFPEIYVFLKLLAFRKKRFPVLIFTPTIDECEALFRIVGALMRRGNFVHSERAGRNEIIEGFKQGKYDYLITTSVLERGVTVKNLQVVVFHADSAIYDDKALIQISGRVGRKSDAWDGEAVFLCNRKNAFIRNSIRQIREANRALCRDAKSA